MTLHERILRLATRSLLPRRSIRLRLTTIYGGLFLISGTGLLAVTYLLVRNATGPSGCGRTRAGFVCAFTSSHRIFRLSLNGPLGFTARQLHEITALAAGQNANDLHQLLFYSGLSLAGMGVVALTFGWVVAGRVLRPLRTITTTARTISATNLDRRLAIAGPDDELKELGDTFDDLLDRLESFVYSQRQFVANAAHELRTPLALQRTLIQLALTDPEADADSLRAAHERVLASEAQQERLLDALLTLARGQTELARRERVDLSGIVEQVVVAHRQEALERHIEIRPSIAPAALDGDPRLVERLVANVVDNALRYNTDEGYIEVATTTVDGGAQLSIVNSGPVVSPDDVERLVQPFQRLGSDRTNEGNGFGLGLSIVAAVAKAHRASLSITAQPEGGLTIRIIFPPMHDATSPDQRQAYGPTASLPGAAPRTQDLAERDVAPASSQPA
ncbi:MAG: HAMP domain-containing sensor histidine kinase [Acidimicrobiales bacterium]